MQCRNTFQPTGHKPQTKTGRHEATRYGARAPSYNSHDLLSSYLLHANNLSLVPGSDSNVVWTGKPQPPPPPLGTSSKIQIKQRVKREGEGALI